MAQAPCILENRKIQNPKFHLQKFSSFFLEAVKRKPQWPKLSKLLTANNVVLCPQRKVISKHMLDQFIKMTVNNVVLCLPKKVNIKHMLDPFIKKKEVW